MSGVRMDASATRLIAAAAYRNGQQVDSARVSQVRDTLIGLANTQIAQQARAGVAFIRLEVPNGDASYETVSRATMAAAEQLRSAGYEVRSSVCAPTDASGRPKGKATASIDVGWVDGWETKRPPEPKKSWW